MAKRTRIIEGTWNCTSCDTKDIPARLRNCPTCNNPREETGQESDFDFGEKDATTGKALREGVSDDKALEAATAGEDWFCEFCGAANRGNNPRCRNCQAERSSASRTLQAEGPPAPPPQPAARSKRPLGLIIALGLLSCFGSCFGFFLWGSRTQAVTGEVADTEWSRTVYRESFQRVSKKGWRDELRATPARMPTQGQGEVAGVENIRACQREQRGTRQVPDGTERVCRQKTRKVACGTEEKCTTRRLGNGFMEETCEDVTKYCNESYEECTNETRYRTEPVYDVSCTYDTHEWKPVDQRTASGRNDTPRWPELSAGANDRLRREEKYAVHIRYLDDEERKEHVLEPPSESEFLSWKPGQKVDLSVSNFGDVKDVRPAGAAP